MINLEKGHVFTEAKKAKFQPNVFLQIVIIIALLFVTQILTSLIAEIGMVLCRLLPGWESGGKLLLSHELPIYYLFMGIGYAAGIGLLLLYSRFIEKRPLASVGFVKKKALSQYAIGLGSGFLLFAAVVMICWVLQAVTFHGIGQNAAVGTLLIFFVFFLFQGMYEEVVLRGCLMVTLANKVPLAAAVTINSLLFAAAHLLNPGVHVLSVVNLVLFGVFASVVMIKTDNIWLVGGLHSVWNFAQGNIFGLQVSGLDVTASLFDFRPVTSKALIHGGTFGPEGGLVVTLIFSLGILFVLCKRTKAISQP